jgi:hypothetical protein
VHCGERCAVVSKEQLIFRAYLGPPTLSAVQLSTAARRMPRHPNLLCDPTTGKLMMRANLSAVHGSTKSPKTSELETNNHPEPQAPQRRSGRMTELLENMAEHVAKYHVIIWHLAGKGNMVSNLDCVGNTQGHESCHLLCKGMRRVVAIAQTQNGVEMTVPSRAHRESLADAGEHLTSVWGNFAVGSAPFGRGM